ncbi:MAG TPA: HD domain-containing phosphohydrolase [Candidatus Eisenbacteria bacterium]|nr:HD domain-containing phosphohydrolase [Candidatus Eisenbacteria bacterium]
MIAAVILAGATALAIEVARDPWLASGRFAFYLLAAVVASGLKVELPGINGTLSVNLIVNLIAVVELSPGEALAVGCISAVCQSLWRKHHIEAVHVVFNLAQMVLSIEVSQLVFHYSARLLGPHLPLRLLATSSAYFLVNTLLVAAVIALTEKRHFGQTWREFYLWSFSNYLVGGVLACFIAWSNMRLGWQASAMMVPVGYLIYRSYRLYLTKLANEKKHVEQMAALHLRTIEALALAIDAKDHTTHDHLQRVRIFAVEVGKEMGLSNEEQEALRAAALLHDIGKLAVPEHIINKPGRLTPEEFEKMKIHPIVGGEILERVNFPYPVVPIVRSHHERWDGKGYPDGLQGEEIPIGARILAAVDCLDALASDRQYRRGIPLNEAMEEIARGAGTQFDARVVRVLQERYEELESKAKALSSSSETVKLSKNVRVVNGDAPAAGFEKAQPVRAGKGDFLASIVAARQEAQTLLEFSIELGRSLSLYETLSLVAARLRKLVPYNAIAIYLVRDDKLIPEYVTGDDFRVFSSLQIPIGEGLSGWVAQNRKPILNGNPSVEPGYQSDARPGSCMSSALAVPLTRGGDEVLGVLALYKMEADAFSTDHLRILLAMTDKIAASIDNAMKYQAAADSAKVDYLTGLPNARSLFLHLDAEISRCTRERGKLAVIVCDLNGFKGFNDKFGHLAGNKLLETFAARLRLVCREYDFISRMGGDEFVLVTPGLSCKAAQEICRRVNAAAAESAREVSPGGEISASVGAAFFPEDATDAEQLLVEADKRMYADKKRVRELEEHPSLRKRSSKAEGCFC